MYKISSFSKISNTSIQTLRYYDSLELLKPKTIGEYNSYRYYTEQQLVLLKEIKKLKDMGFKLRDIAKMINNYDGRLLVHHKNQLQKEANNKLKSIKEIDGIIRRAKNNKKDFQKELVNLINKEERRTDDMKTDYKAAKEALLRCYKLYKDNRFADCIEAIEALKNEIFEDPNQTDPFWTNSAGDLFAGITFEVIKNSKEEDITFLSIFQFKIKDKLFIDDITEYTDALNKDSYSFISLSGVSASPKETKASIVSVFKQKMKPYAMIDVKE